MTSSEIRNSFLKFFEERKHTIVASSPVIPFEDPTLLFTNAGMNQFKDVFLGNGRRPYTRAADTQKCIRVSGKHNDLEEVGRDTYHHTFFEMLGNWSFGDYYKEEAIRWAWELLTDVWKLPKNRLWATVYRNDNEALELWKKVADIDPSHLLQFGEKDNFWEMGETGPCGPCSEIHIDRTPTGNASAEMVNAGSAELIEIWNLVFIQYNRDSSGKLTPLPEKHVDTGMGFERICAVLQNRNSNYDTDIFIPIIGRISEIAGQTYGGGAQSGADIAMRVIADHVRTLTFAVGDGAIPGNEGRGYVLRRILRRAARFGRNLGIHEPFIYLLVPTLVETMSYIFPEIRANMEHIQKVIRSEEESFNSTLDRGLERFDEIIKQIGNSKIFPGDDAFRLYDTFGFPLDLTQLMAAERGLEVDEKKFSDLMNEQKERSRDSGKSAEADPGIKFRAASGTPETGFVGYTQLECESKIIGYEEGFVILDRTPFYAESGGQVGDTGTLTAGGNTYNVRDTVRDGNVIGHLVDKEIKNGIGLKVIACVDSQRRLSVMRNHSATHLLHNALRKVLGKHVQQSGSYVAPDYLRFDFTHFAKPAEKELAEIEKMVNSKIGEDIKRTPGLNGIPFDQAKKMGALMFFGEKYGDRVNVIQFGNFSTEFCGGTHVDSTGEIGYFKILSEGSISSGVRRIEAVTHDYALMHLKSQRDDYFTRVENTCQYIEQNINLEKEISSGGIKTGSEHFSPDADLKRLEELKKSIPLPNKPSLELAASFEELANRNRMLEELRSDLADERKSLERRLAGLRLKSLSGSIDELVTSAVTAGGTKLVAAKVGSASLQELKSLGDTLRSRLGSGIGLLASVAENKVLLVCIVTEDLATAGKIDAGKIVGAVAKLVGGGGGGRPQMATAGGKDVAKLDEAIGQVQSIVESLMKI